MKKLALAPAVALAITGLAASPVIAATEASAPAASADTQPAAQPGALQKTDAQNADAQDGEIAVSADKVSVEDFAENGVGIAGTGLEAETDYKLTVAPADGQNVDAYETTVTTDTEGAFDEGVAAVGKANPQFIGNYSVTVTNTEDPDESHSTAFEVTGDDSDDPETPAADPKISVSDKEVTAEDLQNDGITVEGEGFTPGGEVDLIGGTAQSPFGVATVTADDNGTVSGTIKSEAALEPGEYSVWGSDQETETTSEPVTVTVVEEETEEPSTPAAEAELTVSPETISPADFIDEDKGVTLAVENCEPGEDVKFVVNPEGDSNVTAYENTVNADDEGKASVNVYGTSSDASAYIGDYDVTVTCSDAELTGEFSVSDDANAGGSDGDEDGSGNADGGQAGDGGDLPRTGTELTGLVGGAGLLLIGGISVALTMRRKKTPEDPSEI